MIHTFISLPRFIQVNSVHSIYTINNDNELVDEHARDNETCR